MNLRHVASCGLVCALLALTGCDQGRKQPGEVDVRIVNAAPGFAQLNFRRETRDDASSLTFKGTQEARYGADTYDFYIAESRLDDSAPRVWTFNAQLHDDRGYTFVLTEVAGEIQPIVLEYQAAPANDAQIQGVHAASGMPAMDLYLERPGVGIAGATPRGSFGAQQTIAPRTIPSGDYELFLTAAGNPANVLLHSATLSIPAGITSTFVVVPDPGQATPQISAILVQPVASVVYDRNAEGALRVINAAPDAAPRDFAIDSQFSPPLFSAIPFATPTAFAPLAGGVHTINVTPAGNPGVLELSSQFTSIAVDRATILFSGPAGTLTHVVTSDDGRRFHNEAKLLFMNAATQFTSIDFIITTPGGAVTDFLPVATLAAPGTGLLYSTFPPGDVDLYLRDAISLAILSGPTRLSMAAEGIYSVLAINGPDTATAGVRLLDDFP